MAAGVLALVGAVVLAVAYVVLSERFPYATVHRRQLDVWAVVASLACLGVIVYGGADAQRTVRARRLAALDESSLPKQVYYRVHRADLRTLPSEAEEEPLPDAAVGSEGAVPQEGAITPASDTDARTAPDDGSQNDAAAGGELAADGEPGGFAVPPTLEWVRVILPSDEPPPPRPSPTSTPDPIGVATQRHAPGSTATLPPTPDAPTQEATREPRPTPHCGDPEDIRLRVERLDTSLDRSGSELVVTYRARIRNESAFPATMADVMITALNHDAGSEQFGHATRPDVTLEPGAVITLEGALTLTKMPPPFGSTDLCISFVGESCGRRPPYRVVRQCATVRGF
jgi:hypothetical protein